MLNIDFEFIHELEGCTLEGYVPDARKSMSGVTIGPGYDIGQRSTQELWRTFTPALAGKLVPYSNMQGVSAQVFLHRVPLTITIADAEEIKIMCNTEITQRLCMLWKQSEATVPFGALPEHYQTVVASVACQYGDLSKRTPTFWKYVTAGMWLEAYKELREFRDRYDTRRNKEADYLIQGTVK